MPDSATLVAMGGQFVFFLFGVFLVPNSEGLTIGEQLFGYRLPQTNWEYQPRHDGSQPRVPQEWTPALGAADTVELPALVLSPWFVPRHPAVKPLARGRHAAPEPWDLPQGLRTA